MFQIKRHGKIFGLCMVLTQMIPLSALAEVSSKKIQKVVMVGAPGSGNAAREFSTALRNQLKSADINILNGSDMEQMLGRYPYSAPPSPELAQVMSLIEDGRKAYNLGRNAEASIAKLNNGIQYLENINPSKSASTLLVQAKLNLAYVYFQEHREKEALGILQSLNEINPSLTKEIKRYPPRFKQFILQNREKSSPQRGNVILTSVPDSVDVFVNGIAMGATPSTLTLPIGTWQIGFNAPGRKTIVKKIQVDAEKKIQVKANVPWARAMAEKNLMGSQDIPWTSLSPAIRLSIANKVASTTQANKAVIIDVPQKGNPSAYVFDGRFNQSLKAVVYPRRKPASKEEYQKMLNFYALRLRPLLSADAVDLYKENFDSTIMLDQRIADKGRKPVTKKPAFWAGLGAVVVGGVVTGVLLANQTGSSNPGNGRIVINFPTLK